MDFLIEAQLAIRTALLTYKPEHVVLCFNGGKDATVLLHLALDAMKEFGSSRRLDCLYVEHPDAFQEVSAYVLDHIARLPVNLITVKSAVLREALVVFFEKHPHYEAALIATRATDFKGMYRTSFFQMCDPRWPSIMRVSPLLSWSYQDIWTYIRRHHIGYCSLYDRGFSSLGTKANSVPNKSLLMGNDQYKKPWELEDQGSERDSRV